MKLRHALFIGIIGMMASTAFATTSEPAHKATTTQLSKEVSAVNVVNVDLTINALDGLYQIHPTDMGTFRKKPVVIEAITFAEFIEYGKANGANIVNDMPWSFDYNGHPVSHETDERYLIPTLEGTLNFTPEDMLITGVNGEIYPCKKDIFEKTYEKVE